MQEDEGTEVVLVVVVLGARKVVVSLRVVVVVVVVGARNLVVSKMVVVGNPSPHTIISSPMIKFLHQVVVVVVVAVVIMVVVIVVVDVMVVVVIVVVVAVVTGRALQIHDLAPLWALHEVVLAWL